MRVCIDPGHGGTDPGAVGNGRYEKNETLNISLALRDFLVKYGIEVDMTREKDITLDEMPRVDEVKSSGADICLSIHLNASNGNGTGAETIYQLNNPNSQRLAELTLAELSALGIKQRTAYSKVSQRNPGQDYYFMLRLTRPITSIIVECLFIDNTADAKYLEAADAYQKLAEAIGLGVLKYFGIDPSAAEPDWAKEYFDKLKEYGIIEDAHNSNEITTWGQLAVVINRTIDYLKK